MMLELRNCIIQLGQGFRNVRFVVSNVYQISAMITAVESAPGAVAEPEDSVRDFGFRDKTLRRAFIASEF